MHTRTFGYELEVSSGGGRVMRLLRDAGFTTQTSVHDYHCECRVCCRFHTAAGTSLSFKVQRDDSLGRTGAEFISSPKPWGEDLSWQGRLAALVNQVKKAHAGVNRSCGMHVHVYADDLKDAHLANLVRFSLAHEAVLFRLASAGWGAHRGSRGGYGYSRPLSYYMRSDPAALESLLLEPRDSDMGRYERYNMVNLTPLGRLGTVEFRLWNASTDFKTLRAYIDLSVAMVERAKLGPPTAGSIRRLGMFTRTQKEEPQARALAAFVGDLELVPEVAARPERYRKACLALFERSAWASSLRFPAQRRNYFQDESWFIDQHRAAAQRLTSLLAATVR